MVAILGARQAGKTTLATQLEADWDGPKRHFDPADPDDQARFADPAFVLRELKGLVVLDILEGTFMAFRLTPWHASVSKREVRAPKVYVADTGLLHSLLGIGEQDALMAHPKGGASWEGFILREVIRRIGAKRGEAFFWGVHAGAELDHLYVMCHGEGEPWPLAERMTAIPAACLASEQWLPKARCV